MNILMFSWEYPPLSHGGLARHVQDLSEALVKQGHSLFIITQGDNNIPAKQKLKGVKIFRTEEIKISAKNFIDNILQLNFQMLEEAIKIQDMVDIDIIHGHDWLVFWASRVMKHALKKPLVYTVHATEYGRNQGIYNDMQRYINDLEWHASFEAWKVIVCSNYMKQELKGLFQTPEDKIKIIENGVNIENYQAEYSEDFRKKYASLQESLVFYVGRIVREKGIQILIKAIPQILTKNPDVKFVIAGKGPHLSNLKSQAKFLGIDNRIYFTGYISDEERNKLYQVADLAVFPSLYEPFGIVALEAMATETPVIASNVGGLAEFIKHGKNGYKISPGDPDSLVKSITYLLDNKKEARQMAQKGYKMVKNKYNWDKIAAKTFSLYKKVLKEYKDTEWHKKETRSYIDNEEKLYGSLKYI